MENTSIATLPILTTERLTLRQLAISDADQIFKLRTDSAVNRFLNRQLCNSIDEARDFISKITQSNACYWGITLNDENVFVGTICLFGFSEENYHCEIGFELLKKYQKQGIMKEAVEKVKDYAFDALKVKFIEAHVHSENHSSIRLLEKYLFTIAHQPDKANTGSVFFCLRNPNHIH